MENTILQFTFQILILIFSVVIHEVSHGYAALALGDKTAQYAGRLTLNPIKHIDPFGSVLLPALVYFLGGFIFGWAKPVPYNPYNLRNQKWGPAIVGAAGPLANFSLALVFGVLVRFSPELLGGFGGAFLINFITIASTIALLNLVLALFNLLPIPPLDGSKVLFAILPYQWRNVELFLEQYGFFILLFIVFFLGGLISPVVLFFRVLKPRPRAGALVLYLRSFRPLFTSWLTVGIIVSITNNVPLSIKIKSGRKARNSVVITIARAYYRAAAR